MQKVTQIAERLVAGMSTTKERDTAWCETLVGDFWHNGQRASAELIDAVQRELRRVDPEIATRPIKSR